MSKPVFITIHYLNTKKECINWVNPTDNFEKCNEISYRVIRECAADYDDTNEQNIDETIISDVDNQVLQISNLFSSYAVKNHEAADIAGSIATFTDKENTDYKYILYRFNKSVDGDSKQLEVIRIFSDKEDAVSHVRTKLVETMEYKDCEIDDCRIEVALESINARKERWIYVISRIYN